jgi:ketosteroid isomerase-like protein
MSVKELQGLTQKFADAFDQRDVQPILDMLSEDVEVFLGESNQALAA